MFPCYLCMYQYFQYTNNIYKLRYVYQIYRTQFEYFMRQMQNSMLIEILKLGT